MSRGLYVKIMTSNRNPTPLIDAYLYVQTAEYSYQISPRSALKRRSSLRLFFEEVAPPNKKKNKMSSDVRSVPDLNLEYCKFAPKIIILLRSVDVSVT